MTLKKIIALSILGLLFTSSQAIAARDGTGTMSIPYPDFIAGETINSTQIDDNNAALVLEITNSIPRDGQAAPTANIPFGGYKITGLGNGTASTDAVNKGQLDAAAAAATPADNSVTAAKIATDAVETAKIKDGAVTAAKLASDAVETAKIKDSNVTAGKIADGAITFYKIPEFGVDPLYHLDAGGTSGQVLTSNGDSAHPSWEDASSYGYGTSVYQTTATSVANSTGTFTTIAFDTEDFDDEGWHDNSTNNSRITVDETGRYELSATLGFSTTANGAFAIAYFVNGTEIERYAVESGPTQYPYALNLSARKINLSSGDYVELKAIQYTGGAVNTEPARTRLQVTRIK